MFLAGTFALQAQQKVRILFVLDASGSMWAKMGKETRFEVAKKLLTNMVDSLQAFPDVEVGLRVYGHQSDKSMQNCKDTKLEVAFSPNNQGEIARKLNSITPKGTTLIAYSLQECAADFPTPSNSLVKNIVILITDGLEECEGDPCAVSMALQRQGVILKPFVIGVGGTDDFQKQFSCVGKYFGANTAEDFSNILKIVISQVLNNTTAQVNLLDLYERATETNANMTIYDHKTQKILYNWMHTFNDRGLPDTLYLDPSRRYDIVVHTLPSVRKNNIEILPARHNIIAIDAPQGEIELKMTGVTVYQKLIARVTKKNESATINQQEFNGKQKYLTGNYSLEIFTIPRIYQDVEVNQSKTTIVQLPQPGKLSIFSQKHVVAGIYQLKNGQMEWVCDIDGTARQQTIYMQPGTYSLIGRVAKESQTISTFNRSFTITSASSTNLNL